MNIDGIRTLIEKGAFAKAVQESDKLLSENPKSGPLLLQRANAHLKAGELQKALEDAELAVVYSEGAKRANAQLKRGICLYRLGKLGQAKRVFEYAKDTSEPNQLELWNSKAKSAVAEDVELIPYSSRAIAAPNPSAPSGPRKDWYQSSNTVTLDIYVRNAPKDANVEITSKRVSIDYPDFSFSLDLLAEIDPSKSSFDIRVPKIELVLAKVDKFQWPKLEYDASFKQQTTKEQSSSAQPVAKTDFKPFFERNWNVDADDEADEKNADPNAFFEQIYKNADPDTKRAMAKSFTESKGTSLSTNWDEVSKGTVEPLPPKDMNFTS